MWPESTLCPSSTGIRACCLLKRKITMSVYYTLCFLAALAIFIAFANQYVVKIQTTIAITAGSMLISALMVLFGKLGWFNLEPLAVETMESIDFQNFLLKGWRRLWRSGWVSDMGAPVVELKGWVTLTRGHRDEKRGRDGAGIWPGTTG